MLLSLRSSSLRLVSLPHSRRYIPSRLVLLIRGCLAVVPYRLRPCASALSSRPSRLVMPSCLVRLVACLLLSHHAVSSRHLVVSSSICFVSSSTMPSRRSSRRCVSLGRLVFLFVSSDCVLFACPFSGCFPRFALSSSCLAHPLSRFLTLVVSRPHCPPAIAHASSPSPVASHPRRRLRASSRSSPTGPI